MKKSIKWFLILAVLMGLVCVMAGCGEKEVAADDGYKIAWNTDGTAYYDIRQDMTLRMHSGDYYRARFAIDGEQIDLFFPDEVMMTKADKYMFVALKYDENFVVTDCKTVDEVTGGMGVWNYYIESVTDTELVCNSAANYKGVPLTIRLDENTKTYNIGGTGLLVGLPGTAEAGGRVYAVLGHNGVATHLFVAGAFQTSPVYWNVERKYDSTSKMTSRERDALGYFVYDMIVDGEPVQFRVMDMDVASQIDSFGAKCMHLVFDADGNIIEAQHARNATGGNTVASWYHVTDYIAIENAFTAEKFSGSDKGSKGTFTLANACKIYDMSGKGAFIGEQTTLRVGDQVHGLSNATGEVIILFVVSRNADVDLYYNLERYWNSNAKESTRKPDADGWYYFNFSVNGEHVRLKTQDPNVVYTIDERAARVLGLELEGDVIKAAYKPSSVTGRNNTAFDYTLVTEVDGDVVTTTRNGKTYRATLSSDCEVYNVSSSAGVKGEKTTVQVGDIVYGLAGMDKKVNEIYVTKRAYYSHLYWNLDRNYDTTNKVTKRTPDADGYYWFRFVDDGKLVTYKTKSKTMANQIDSWVAIGMQYDEDLITKAFKYDEINGLGGGGFGSWEIVTSISYNTLKTTKSTGTMSSRVKVYNVSTSAIQPGELTKLKVGDRIHGVKDDRGKIMYIFVVGRAIETDLYYNVERMWENNASTRTPDADGFYHFTMSVNGAHVELKTDDPAIVKTIDGRTGRVLGLALDGDVILAAYAQNNVKGSETTTFDWAKVTEIREDGTIVATRNGNTYTGKPSADCEIYNVSGVAEMIGEVTTVEVGDTLYGFSNAAGEVTEIYVVGRTPKTKTKVAYCAYCDAEVTWSEWLGTDLAGGHFFLDGDVEVSAAQLVAEGTVTCLDLNGHKATGKSNLDRMFNIYGVFNLFDTKKADGTFDGGLVTTYNNSASTRVGNIFYIQNKAGAVFNMYGGNLTSTGTVSKGKIGGITRVMNIYDGTISGGVATGYGGSLRLEAVTAELNIMGGTLTAGAGTAANGGGVIYMSSGKVNMSGGTIVGGTVKTNGGAVCVEGKNAFFTLSGGTIKGGSAKNGGAIMTTGGASFTWTGGTIVEGTATYGKSIFISASDKFTVSNKVSVNGVYLNDAKIIVENLDSASRIGITMATPGVFATCADAATAESLKESFVSQMAGYVTVVNDAQLLLGEPGEEPQPAHTHCLCGDNTKGVGDHTACTDQTWEPWTGTWESGKYYYLTEDYNCTATIAVTKNQVLNLCLNGHKFNGGSSVDRIFNVYGTVNICDHKTGGAYKGQIISNRTNTSKTGGVFYTQNSSANGYGVFNLYGGILTATGQMKNGGICGLGNALNMYDGIITGGKATTAGGNIYMENNGYSSFKMYGGTVSNGEAPTGGNIRAGNTTVIAGGSIYGGTATQGADIYLNRAAGTLTLSGIIGTNGGTLDVYVNAGTLTTTELDPSVKIKVTEP